MPALFDILIRQPPERVWAVIADQSSHPSWLNPGFTTEYRDEELVEGGTFTRTETKTGRTYDGEVVAVRYPRFLKVRADRDPDHFVTSEYHLISVPEGCALRLLWEVYDTSDKQHSYFPELVEQNIISVAQRLKDYCEKS